MQCPQCNARTEVREKRGPFRERRCTNTACGIAFTTREHLMSLRGQHRPCARTRATKIGTPNPLPYVGVEDDGPSVERTVGAAVGSASSGAHVGFSDLEGGAGGVQQEPPYLEAEAGA